MPYALAVSLIILLGVYGPSAIVVAFSSLDSADTVFIEANDSTPTGSDTAVASVPHSPVFDVPSKALSLFGALFSGGVMLTLLYGKRTGVCTKMSIRGPPHLKVSFISA